MALENVPRCQHIKMNGIQCGSPALRGRRQCFFHERAREQHNRIVKSQFRQARFVLPVLEDANAVQMALMQVMQLLAWGEIDRKVAGLLLFGLQTASANLRDVDFEPSEPTDVVINREDIRETDIGGPQWCPEDFDLEEGEEEEEDEEEMEEDEEEEEEEEEEGVEENEAATPAVPKAAATKDLAAVVSAERETADSPAASDDGVENGGAVPSMEEVREQIRGLVHNYIQETAGAAGELSG